MKNTNRILIIGAGASGMAAALSALREGADVVVLEHNSEAGKKLLLTGNGACNYTNTDVSPKHYHASDPHFVESVIGSFSFDDCISWFRLIGIEPMIRRYRFDETGYVYPAGGNAASLRDALYGACCSLGARFLFSANAEQLKITEEPSGGFHVQSDFLKDEHFDALILAAGSNAYPATGSDSSVYPLLKQFDLGFQPFLPALCALYSRDEKLKELKGKRSTEHAVLYINGEEAAEAFGEVQFTEHTVSGIPVMQISSFASRALKSGRKVMIRIGENSFDIYRTAGFERAQCCAGGIDLSCVSSTSMESLRQKGIFICGELLDVDGECGGYNLHFAWASGVLAGRNAAQKEI